MLSFLFIAAAEAAQAGESAGLPQLDSSTWASQLVWLAITFGVLYWLMSSMFLPRIGAAIEERRDRIADDLDKAAESRRQAEEAETAFNKALAEARAKAQAVTAEAREEVNAEIDAMRKDAEQSIAVKAAAAEDRIAKLRETAGARVKEAARDTTRAVVEALIHESPADSVVDAAVAKAAKA